MRLIGCVIFMFSWNNMYNNFEDKSRQHTSLACNCRKHYWIARERKTRRARRRTRRTRKRRPKRRQKPQRKRRPSELLSEWNFSIALCDTAFRSSLKKSRMVRRLVLHYVRLNAFRSCKVLCFFFWRLSQQQQGRFRMLKAKWNKTLKETPICHDPNCRFLFVFQLSVKLSVKMCSGVKSIDKHFSKTWRLHLKLLLMPGQNCKGCWTRMRRYPP